MNENKNLLLAVVLCAAVFIGWEYFVVQPQLKSEQARIAQQTELSHKTKGGTAHPAARAPKLAAPTPTTAHLSRAEALRQSGTRITIDTPTVDGSLLLKGARFDDLRLKKYRETVDPKSPEIALLAPQGADYPYYAVFGWVAPPDSNQPMPDNETAWTLAGGSELSPGHPVTLRWENGHGLVFTRQIAVDDQYMFTVSDTVANKSDSKVTLYPYAYVVRDGVPASEAHSSWYIHQGFVGYADGSAKYTKYSDLKDKPDQPQTFHSTGGWVGITDKYWMAAVIPPQSQKYESSYAASNLNGTVAYQSDYRLAAHDIAPGGTTTVTQHLFAGAKVVKILQSYQKKLGIQGFDFAIDWGWFSVITRPMFWLLDEFYTLVGNFGIAILLLTVTVKLIFFPLANASYASMSRMKKVQPEMTRIRERFADDRARQQQEMMELYKREKVNPVSGCLPMLIQVPVFYALYKVLYVTIEMRHAPFFGWIHDLSAPDPTSILNLFGLLSYQIPHFIPAFLSIGIWPILMGITQWLQTKLNPAPTDPIQARMFAFMPLIFTFMLATFPAGLVIYWTWNNLLSVTQQYFIMRRQGAPVHLFENLKFFSSKRREKSEPAAGE